MQLSSISVRSPKVFNIQRVHRKWIFAFYVTIMTKAYARVIHIVISYQWLSELANVKPCGLGRTGEQANSWWFCVLELLHDYLRPIQ